jgi:Cdc6-like AAA superfamily ATPase
LREEEDQKKEKEKKKKKKKKKYGRQRMENLIMYLSISELLLLNEAYRHMLPGSKQGPRNSSGQAVWICAIVLRKIVGEEKRLRQGSSRAWLPRKLPSRAETRSSRW